MNAGPSKTAATTGPKPAAPVIDVVADTALAAEVADVAAITFPLACPPHCTDGDIAAFVANNFRPANFVRHIQNPESDLLVAREGRKVIGYSLIHHTPPSNPDVTAVVTERPASEISKMYVLPGHHGSAVAAALMTTALGISRDRGSVVAWLGVNQHNHRARGFYTKMGFTRVGEKTFDLNGNVEHDFVLSRRL
ncbi:MAG: GNAT family N-acetyltransferase [Gordonia amarae]